MVFISQKVYRKDYILRLEKKMAFLAVAHDVLINARKDGHPSHWFKVCIYVLH